jgi:hypothetical protein
MTVTIHGQDFVCTVCVDTDLPDLHSWGWCGRATSYSLLSPALLPSKC